MEPVRSDRTSESQCRDEQQRYVSQRFPPGPAPHAPHHPDTSFHRTVSVKSRCLSEQFLADALANNEHLIGATLDSLAEHVTVGLKLVNLPHVPADQPNKRIEPQDDLAQIEKKRIEKMTETTVRILVGQYLLGIVFEITLGYDHVASQRTGRRIVRNHDQPAFAMLQRLTAQNQPYRNDRFTKHFHQQEQHSDTIREEEQAGPRQPGRGALGYSVRRIVRFPGNEDLRFPLRVRLSSDLRGRNSDRGMSGRRDRYGRRQQRHYERADRNQQQDSSVQAKTRLFPHQKEIACVEQCRNSRRFQQIDQQSVHGFSF